MDTRPVETPGCPRWVTSSSTERPRPPLIPRPATIRSDGRSEETTVERTPRQAPRTAQGCTTEAERVPSVSQPEAPSQGLPDLWHICRT